MRGFLQTFSLIIVFWVVQFVTKNIPSPHLVPLPMGEETLLSLPLHLQGASELLANLASPLGRGARQRVRGLDGETKNNSNRRIASTSLCGDSYVLSMFGDQDITALSWQSGDAVSIMPPRLTHLPKARDDVETLLGLNPKLVVFGPGEGALAKPILHKRGIKSVTLQWGEDFESVSTNEHLLREATGIDARINKVIPNKPKQSSPRPSVLYLTADGATAGTGTYVDAAIRAAGGANIITTQGWHAPSLESLVGKKPDLIVTSFFETSYASINEAGLRNKILRDKLKAIPHVKVPGKLWPCAGPGLYEARAIIGDAIAELDK